MPSRKRWIGPAELVEEFGFTERHWIRQAAAGRVPSARQPFGPRSSWVFDLEEVRRWWASTEQVQAAPIGSRLGARGGFPKRLNSKPSFERRDLKKTLAKVLAEHPDNQKRKR